MNHFPSGKTKNASITTDWSWSIRYDSLTNSGKCRKEEEMEFKREKRHQEIDGSNKMLQVVMDISTEE